MYSNRQACLNNLDSMKISQGTWAGWEVRSVASEGTDPRSGWSTVTGAGSVSDTLASSTDRQASTVAAFRLRVLVTLAI